MGKILGMLDFRFMRCIEMDSFLRVSVIDLELIGYFKAEYACGFTVGRDGFSYGIFT